jgi:hypothetical protein
MYVCMYVCIYLAHVIAIIDVNFNAEKFQRGVSETAQYEHRDNDDYRGGRAH